MYVCTYVCTYVCLFVCMSVCRDVTSQTQSRDKEADQKIAEGFLISALLCSRNGILVPSTQEHLYGNGSRVISTYSLIDSRPLNAHVRRIFVFHSCQRASVSSICVCVLLSCCTVTNRQAVVAKTTCFVQISFIGRCWAYC